MFLINLFSSLLLTLLIGLSPSKQPLNQIDEIWEGVGLQDDDSTWTIRITISNNQYSIDYPSLGCGGRLDLIGSSENNYSFREILSYGKSICIDGGETVFSKTGENLARFTWFYPNGNKGAVGTLSRKHP